MGSESNPPAFAATLWGNGSLLIHTIESPAFTVMTGGVKATASIVTVWVTGRGGAAAPGPLHDSSPGTARARSSEPRMTVLATTSTGTTGPSWRGRDWPRP